MHDFTKKMDLSAGLVEGQIHMKALTFLITSVDRKILVEKRELHTAN